MPQFSRKTFHIFADTSLAYMEDTSADVSVPDVSLQAYHPPLTDLVLEGKLKYRFHPHFHPYTDKLINRLIEGSVRGLQELDTEYARDDEGRFRPLPESTRVRVTDGRIVTLRDGIEIRLDGTIGVTLPSSVAMSYPEGTDIELLEPAEVTFLNGSSRTYPSGTRATLIGVKPRPELYEELFNNGRYEPSDELVARPYPVKDLDFTSSGAYAVYNWELLYHAPLTIAIHLSKNQRFDEAMRWFHLVFDPTDDSDGPTPDRFWKVRPFQYSEVKLIEEVLVNLATGADPDLLDNTIKCLEVWAKAPFRPHLVARYRQTPYMLKAVMAYLDNLIAWGDSLYRRDTRESTNEATQRYVLAANILGVRPQLVPKKGRVRPQTYANLKSDLAAFGVALRDREDMMPFDSGPDPTEAVDLTGYNTLRSIGHALYFCVPRNDKLLSYWDTVADRLFKIRNSLNLQGVFRQLPLFEPPIDPALLAKATAAGLDVGAIAAGIHQPLPLVRFQFLIQKAAEICQEVKSLGNSMLAAIEKEDNEALATLRAKHETGILAAVETVKYQQLQEALKTLEGLQKSLALPIERYTYFQRLLDQREAEIAIPEVSELDSENLKKMDFRQDDPTLKGSPISINIARDTEGIGSVKFLSYAELLELNKLEEAKYDQVLAGVSDILGSVVGIIPNFSLNTSPIGVGFSTAFGGSNLAAGMGAASNYFRTESAIDTYNASRAIKMGSYERREQDWRFQSNLAAGEISQIYKQIRAAQIRAAVANQELENHRKSMTFATEIERFLKGEQITVATNQHSKINTQGFYAWLKREVKSLHAQAYELAFDVAKQAERALQHELGDPMLSFLRFDYLAGKEGLLAGEKLHLDIKRMEMAYHDQNRREYELTKHVSLMQVDPLALMQLRTTGSCTVALPEAIFDLDCPGHYFRRIKSVALSIPCVTGPYSSINCTLTLQKSTIRKTAQLDGLDYNRQGAEDPRFSDHFGSLQSIVTSVAQSDSGMFETNLRDERYLPFENSGVISEWLLQLPGNPSTGDPLQFDYDTISDVILHIRYTAREGGATLRGPALRHVSGLINTAEAAGCVRLFSMRHEFPTEWARFKATTIDDSTRVAPLVLEFREEHYPFWSKRLFRDGGGAITRVQALAKTSSPVTVCSAIDEHGEGTGVCTSLEPTYLGDLCGADLAIPPASLVGPYNLYFSSNDIDDLWLAVSFGAAP